MADFSIPPSPLVSVILPRRTSDTRWLMPGRKERERERKKEREMINTCISALINDTSLRRGSSRRDPPHLPHPVLWCWETMEAGTWVTFVPGGTISFLIQSNRYSIGFEFERGSRFNAAAAAAAAVAKNGRVRRDG